MGEFCRYRQVQLWVGLINGSFSVSLERRFVPAVLRHGRVWQLPYSTLRRCADVRVKKVKADIALHGNPISDLRNVTCHMGSHSVTCHPTQVNAPRLTTVMQAGTRFTYPGGMEGWVDLVHLIAPRPRVEPATFRSRVRRPTTAPRRQWTRQCRGSLILNVIW